MFTSRYNHHGPSKYFLWSNRRLSDDSLDVGPLTSDDEQWSFPLTSFWPVLPLALRKNGLRQCQCLQCPLVNGLSICSTWHDAGILPLPSGLLWSMPKPMPIIGIALGMGAALHGVPEPSEDRQRQLNYLCRFFARAVCLVPELSEDRQRQLSYPCRSSGGSAPFFDSRARFAKKL